MNKLYKKNMLNIPNTLQSINSWRGHASHCNSFKLQTKILNDCSFLLNSKSYSQMEQNLIVDLENSLK